MLSIFSMFKILNFDTVSMLPPLQIDVKIDSFDK